MIIYRSKINNIIFEFLPSSDNKGVVIICDGLPTIPKQKDLMSFFSSQGFFVIYPRYQGTWESRGEFLKESPVNDILNIIKLVKSGKITELFANKEFIINNKDIYLVGASFGGSVTLSLANNNDVLKIVALSPVVNFKEHNDEKNEQDLIMLGRFIKKAFGRAYQFTNKNWQKMVKGDIFNPIQNLNSSNAKKILILFDKTDQSISYKKIEDYSSRNNIIATEIKDEGHLSFSKLTQEVKNKIINWLTI